MKMVSLAGQMFCEQSKTVLSLLFFCAAISFAGHKSDKAEQNKIDPNNVEWKTIIFGQSTLADKNSVVVDPGSKTVTLTAGNKDGTVTGGKVAASHDGISYYYTTINPDKNFVLTAKVKVNYFAKEKPDNQEAFGIMARDAIGKNLDPEVFPSNMVMVGGYRGEIGSVFRNFIKDTTGAGGKMEDAYRFSERPANDGSVVYTLSMKKTNTGYHVSVNGSTENIYYRPKELEMLDKSNIYVGFFTARVASITVSDIVLTTSEVSTDPAKIAEPVKKIAPSVKILSSSYASTSNYTLSVSSNLSGNLSIKLNGKDTSYIIKEPGIFNKDFKVTKGTNTFDLAFIPDSNKTDTLKVEHILSFKTFGYSGGFVYASPVGNDSAKGTLNNPLDIYTAVEYSQPGQTILLTSGTYRMPRPLIIEKGNNGSAGKFKTLRGTGNVVLDFSDASEGLFVFGNYWKLYGLDVTKGAKGGVRVFGNYNVLELLNTYVNGNTGIQLSGYSTDKIDTWPSYNLVLNCESYNNKDASENDADGFGAKLTCGVGNVFRGCIAHNNCDDGWDLYSKLETGAIGAVVIENCIAYSNGILSNGYTTKGDGNGFKLGGEGLAVPHVLKNSLAFGNKAMGITNNSDPAIIVQNNTSFDNGLSNYDFNIYNTAKPQFAVNNNVSFRSFDGKNDKSVDSLRSPNNYFYLEKSTVNSEGKKLTIADFKSVKVETFKRYPDGTIAPVNFMALKFNPKMTSGAKVNDLVKVTAIPQTPQKVLMHSNTSDSTKTPAIVKVSSPAKPDSIKVATPLPAPAPAAKRNAAVLEAEKTAAPAVK
jgi:pectate disaccharide-lyase